MYRAAQKYCLHECNEMLKTFLHYSHSRSGQRLCVTGQSSPSHSPVRHRQRAVMRMSCAFRPAQVESVARQTCLLVQASKLTQASLLDLALQVRLSLQGMHADTLLLARFGPIPHHSIKSGIFCRVFVFERRLQRFSRHVCFSLVSDSLGGLNKLSAHDQHPSPGRETTRRALNGLCS